MPDAGASNIRGPCSSCGTPLATDQRYCIECGQRVGPPLALPYALPPGAPPPAAGSWVDKLPMPAQMVSAFAALALGFGAVVGTAISPDLAGIIAAPSPGVIAEAPPETPPASTGGGGGAPTPSGGSAALASTPSAVGIGSGSGGGGGGSGGKKKKKKKKKPAPTTFTGTVVRVNPVAGSYTISNGGLIAIHADSLPDVGQKLEVPVRKLANGTYAESGAHNAVGLTDAASLTGTVTHCVDLEQRSEPCDGGHESDHYVYTVSSLGASVLVTWPHSAGSPPPAVGDAVQVDVRIGAAFQSIAPSNPDDWRSDASCNPAYDEQAGLPNPPVVAKELTQASVTVTGQATGAALESVVQTECPGETASLILSADDVRQAGRDLASLDVPNGFDLNKLTPGQAVQVAVDIANDDTLTLTGITSDQGAGGADDPTQGQGTLAGS